MIYLASTSPRRRKLLKEASIAFRAVRPDYEEKNYHRISPVMMVKKHALEKAVSCVCKVREGKLLGSDTLVYCDGEIVGKPKNMKDAFRILNLLQSRWHTVYTGVAVLEIKDHHIVKKRIFSEKTKVCIKPMSRLAIKSYFKKINPLDKAGAYAIQSKGANIIAEVKGSLSNAIGLPVESLRGYLSNFP